MEITSEVSDVSCITQQHCGRKLVPQAIDNDVAKSSIVYEFVCQYHLHKGIDTI